MHMSTVSTPGWLEMMAARHRQAAEAAPRETAAPAAPAPGREGGGWLADLAARHQQEAAQVQQAEAPEEMGWLEKRGRRFAAGFPMLMARAAGAVETAGRAVQGAGIIGRAAPGVLMDRAERLASDPVGTLVGLPPAGPTVGREMLEASFRDPAPVNPVEKIGAALGYTGQAAEEFYSGV